MEDTYIYFVDSIIYKYTCILKNNKKLIITTYIYKKKRKI